MYMKTPCCLDFPFSMGLGYIKYVYLHLVIIQFGISANKTLYFIYYLFKLNAGSFKVKTRLVWRLLNENVILI